MRNAPVARGFFTSDYEGLAAIGTDFRPVFVQARGTPGISDAWSTLARPLAAP